MTTKQFFLLLFICSFNSFLFGQKKEEAVKQVQLELKDGNTVQGKLITRNGDTVVIETATLGTLNINIKSIKSITVLDAQRLKDGQYWFENSHSTRGFFVPTGYGLRKGEGYYSNIYLFLNSAAYGFTDNFTVGVGSDVLTIFSGNPPILMYITPKFSFQASDNFSYGVGVLAASIGTDLFSFDGYDKRSSEGIVYGVGTFGSRDNNISLAFGYGYSGNDWAKRPVATISGQYRVARNVGLMTENYILSEAFVGVTGGRFMNSNFSFDLGLMYASGIGSSLTVFPLPFLGIAFPFGHKKL
jgi:hypothetical protein